jgi:membrane-associated phospholipid phosphatase
MASCLAFACYWLWPVCIARPSYAGPGVGLWLMREVVAVDGAANCTPSSHAIFAILPALLIQWRAKSCATRAAVWAAAVAVCATTVTTGQHYYLDPVAGAGTALAAAYLVRLAFPRGTV